MRIWWGITALAWYIFALLTMITDGPNALALMGLLLGLMTTIMATRKPPYVAGGWVDCK